MRIGGAILVPERGATVVVSMKRVEAMTPDDPEQTDNDATAGQLVQPGSESRRAESVGCRRSRSESTGSAMGQGMASCGSFQAMPISLAGSYTFVHLYSIW